MRNAVRIAVNLSSKDSVDFYNDLWELRGQLPEWYTPCELDPYLEEILNTFWDINTDRQFVGTGFSVMCMPLGESVMYNHFLRRDIPPHAIPPALRLLRECDIEYVSCWEEKNRPS